MKIRIDNKKIRTVYRWSKTLKCLYVIKLLRFSVLKTSWNMVLITKMSVSVRDQFYAINYYLYLESQKQQNVGEAWLHAAVVFEF